MADARMAQYAVLPLISLDSTAGYLTSLAQDGDIVAVGTSVGQLLLYQADAALNLSGPPWCETNLCKSTSKRAMRAVRQLVVLAASGVVIALCDGIVSVHSIESLEQLCILNNPNTRADTFAANVEDERLPRVVLAVSAHKSLLFYRLANPVQLFRELELRVEPSQIVWQGEMLSLATARGLKVPCHPFPSLPVPSGPTTPQPCLCAALSVRPLLSCVALARRRSMPSTSPPPLQVIDATVGHTVLEHNGGGQHVECCVYEFHRWLPVRGIALAPPGSFSLLLTPISHVLTGAWVSARHLRRRWRTR